MKNHYDILENGSIRLRNGLEKFQLLSAKIPHEGLILIILCSVFLTWIPRPNEEQYLALSKYFMDSSWIKNCHNLNEFAGTRLIYQIITGTLLKFLSFEQTVFVGRLMICVFYAFGLARLYRSLDFGRSMVLLQLGILYLTKQSYFAGSWIFLGFEAKSFAYGFVFLALAAFVNRHTKRMLIYLVFASYFHLLVGGFVSIYLLLCLWLFDKDFDFKKTCTYGVIYLFAMLPLIIYMQSALSVDLTSVPSPSWIYTYFRNPHHTVIFRDLGYFRGIHERGVYASIAGLILLVLVYHALIEDKIKKIAQFAIVTFLAALIFIIIGAFDKEGVILKFYLYRINALSVFCTYLVFTFFLFQSINRKLSIHLKYFTACLALFAIQKMANSNYENLVYDYKSSTSTFELICADIKEKTDEDDITLLLTNKHDESLHLKFNRYAERNRFVIHKFVPAEFGKLPDWYDRLKTKESLHKDISRLKQISEKYKIDYVLAQRSYPNLELVAERGHYKLYDLNIK